MPFQKAEENMSKVLTVVIPSYNVEQFLEKTVQSFLDEEILDDIEILIVNDGSKDQTKEIGLEFEKKYPQSVKLVDKENGGHGSTINKGLLLATGKYFKVVDGDDWVDTKAFVSYVKHLKTLDVDMVFTPFNEVYIPSMRTVKRATANVQTNKVYVLSDVLADMGDCYQMHGITFRTNLIKNKLKITEKCFYVDQEYILLPLKDVKNVIFLDYTIYQYRLGDVNQSVSVTNKQKNREMHKKVVMRLLHEFETEKDELTKEQIAFLKQRLTGLVYTQLDIYFSMGNVYEEFKFFWEAVKAASQDIYKDMSGFTANMIKCSKKLGYAVGTKRLQKKLNIQA